MGRNGYMLNGSLAKRGYDWWWHSLVGHHKETGEPKPFFIEYYVINPALGGKEPILGQHPDHKNAGRKPSYAMLKAGCWVPGGAVQIHNFYGVHDFNASSETLDVRIGPHTASETHLKGAVELSQEQATAHPEYLSEHGSMQWDLKARKVLTYDVGYGASAPARASAAFDMFWHVQGMRTEYDGTILFNGEEYVVTPEKSCGYQDKNWGRDYTNPWIWLNCNNFVSATTGQRLPNTSLVVGGGCPVVFGVKLDRRILVAFQHDSTMHEYNFTKVWTRPVQRFLCQVTPSHITWKVKVWNKDSRLSARFSCPRNTMLLVKYENPDGAYHHRQLWNGGWASGQVTLDVKGKSGWERVDTFRGEMGGCEWGAY